MVHDHLINGLRRQWLPLEFEEENNFFLLRLRRAIDVGSDLCV